MMLDVATLSWIIFPLTHGNTCLMLSHTTRRRLTCPVAMETAPASTMWPLFVAEIIQHAGQSQVSGLRSRPSGPLCELLDGVFNANAAFRSRQISEEESRREEEALLLEGCLRLPCTSCTMWRWGTNEAFAGQKNRFPRDLKTSDFCRNDTAAPQCPKHGTAIL